MILQEVTTILKVLLGAFQPIASQDALTQRRIGQIGEVIGAVEDVAEDEAEEASIAAKRTREAHDIIHRVAAILAMEEEGGGGEDGDGDGEDGSVEESATAAAGTDTGTENEDALREVPWNGKLDGETIELAEEEME